MPLIIIMSKPVAFNETPKNPPKWAYPKAFVRGDFAAIVVLEAVGQRVPRNGPTENIRRLSGENGSTLGGT